MPDVPDQGEVIVEGERIKPQEFDGSDIGLGGSYANFIPSWWGQLDLSGGTAGLEAVHTTELLANSDIVITLQGMSLRVIIPAGDWAKMPKNLQTAIEMVLKNAFLSGALRDALSHINNANPEAIILKVDTVYHMHNGATAPFSQNNPFMNISYDFGSDQSATTIKNGSKIIININETRLNNAMNFNVESFEKLFIHELFHPIVPDINGNDHDRVEPLADTAVRDLFFANYQKSPKFDASIASLGSRNGDVLRGGDNDDALAGMEGNDDLNGRGGSNIVYGGIGLDHLTSEGVNDLLAGGLEADTYTVAATSWSPYIREDGGIDRINLSGAISDYTVTRFGDSLVLSVIAPAGQHQITIDGWYTNDSRRVELFTFGDGTYGASYMEALADGRPEGGCYDASGQPIQCNVYGTPVVIDLDGDGLTFVDAEHSNVRFDIDGDGVVDRVSWIAPEDGLLLFDRDGDGGFTGYSEISFTGDLRGAATDLEGLLAQDTNRDGFFTAADANFGRFFVWVDANSNGRSEAGEVRSLYDHGIDGFDLEIISRTRLDDTDIGSQALGFGRITGSGAAVAIDAALRYIPGETCGCTGRSSLLGNDGRPSSDGGHWATVAEY